MSQEGGQNRRGPEQRDEDGRICPAPVGGGGQAVGEPHETERRQQPAAPVDGRVLRLVAALRHAPERETEGDQGHRKVDEEDRPPRPCVDQPAAEHRAERGRQRREARPGADGPAALVLRKGRADDGEAARDEQSAADTLHGAGGDQRGGVRRQPAPDGGGGEDDDAHDEDTAAPEAVAGRAADQDQGTQQQHVGVDDPLSAPDGCGQLALNRGQRDADDRAVDERHAGAEDGRSQHPWLGALGTAARLRRRGADHALVAWRPADADHRPPGRIATSRELRTGPIRATPAGAVRRAAPARPSSRARSHRRSRRRSRTASPRPRRAPCARSAACARSAG